MGATPAEARSGELSQVQRATSDSPAAGYSVRPAALYHPLTRFYDLGCALLGYGSGFRRWLIELADLKPGERVLDLGCGTGVLAEWIAARAETVRVSAIDPDLRALRAAGRRRVPGRVAALGERLPFPDGCFDRVISTLAAHHVPDAFRAAWFGEVRRTLRPGGCFVYADFENHGRVWIPRRFRSAWTLPEWLESTGFLAERVGLRRGVHVFRARAAPFHPDQGPLGPSSGRSGLELSGRDDVRHFQHDA